MLCEVVDAGGLVVKPFNKLGIEQHITYTTLPEIHKFPWRINKNDFACPFTVDAKMFWGLIYILLKFILLVSSG